MSSESAPIPEVPDHAMDTGSLKDIVSETNKMLESILELSNSAFLPSDAVLSDTWRELKHRCELIQPLVSDCEVGPPQLLVVGQSNSGKSSLINEMLGQTVVSQSQGPNRVAHQISKICYSPTSYTNGSNGQDETEQSPSSIEEAPITFVERGLPNEFLKQSRFEIVDCTGSSELPPITEWDKDKSGAPTAIVYVIDAIEGISVEVEEDLMQLRMGCSSSQLFFVLNKVDALTGIQDTDEASPVGVRDNVLTRLRQLQRQLQDLLPRLEETSAALTALAIKTDDFRASRKQAWKTILDLNSRIARSRDQADSATVLLDRLRDKLKSKKPEIQEAAKDFELREPMQYKQQQNWAEAEIERLVRELQQRCCQEFAEAELTDRLRTTDDVITKLISFQDEYFDSNRPLAPRIDKKFSIKLDSDRHAGASDKTSSLTRRFSANKVDFMFRSKTAKHFDPKWKLETAKKFTSFADLKPLLKQSLEQLTTLIHSLSCIAIGSQGCPVYAEKRLKAETSRKTLVLKKIYLDDRQLTAMAAALHYSCTSTRDFLVRIEHLQLKRLNDRPTLWKLLVSPENRSVRLSDVGQGRYTPLLLLRREATLPSSGCPPELLPQPAVAAAVGQIRSVNFASADTFSLGAVLKALIFGSKSPPKFEEINDEISTLIEDCIQSNPAQRPTPADVAERLRQLLKEPTKAKK
uniref:G domain-containing protein n=1 Tax=Macrostomum lignano TaxID=282301 RepID=A0A1I8H0Y0_9PLAT